MGASGILPVLMLVAGASGLLALARPRLVPALLVAGAILTSGMMPQGYTIVDEVFAGAVVLGALVVTLLKAKPLIRIESTTLGRLHWLCYLAFVAYLVLQSVRGLMLLESPQKLRWITFHILAALLPVVFGVTSFRFSRSSMSSCLVVSTLTYLLLYMFLGLIAEFVLKTSRWSPQLVWWGTSAYALMPVAVAMPGVAWCVSGRRRVDRVLGWLTFAAAVAAAFYYDSRVTVFCTILFLLVGPFALGVRKSVAAVFLLVLIFGMFILYIWPSYRDVDFFLEDLFGSGSALWESGSGHDVDRAALLRVTFRSISADWVSIFFGHGYRVHGQVIGPYLRSFYLESGRPDKAARVREDESAEAFTALVVDTGLVGFGLLLANFLLVARQIMAHDKTRYRYAVLLSVVVLFAWTFVINILDVVLFYLAIMPSGIMVSLARGSSPAVTSHPHQ